jgi:hypothetical protein
MPNGPSIHVWLPLVNAVRLSALRRTNSPLVVDWSPSPLIGLWVSLAAQSPTMPGMALCSAANPRMNVNDTG